MKTNKTFVYGIFAVIIALAFVACDNGSDGGGTTHVHDYEWTVTTPATCIATGEESGVCKLDPSHTTTRKIPIDPTAHDWGEWEGTVTCTEAGTGTRVCSRSESHIEERNDLQPLGHNYKYEETTAPTCTTAGEETGTCTHDSTHTTTLSIAALGHDYQWITSSSFIEEGVETEVCSHDSSHTRGTRATAQLPITTTADWNSALAQLNGKTGSYTLTISGNIAVVGSFENNSFGTTADGSALSVTLKGSGKLYLSSQGCMLRIAANQTLIIDSEDLILEGLKNGQNSSTRDNTSSVVYVSGVFNGATANLELLNGTITGNAGTGSGGGVSLMYGTFIMYGGEISGNTASMGGGVNMYEASFTMYGGKISDNTASGNNSPDGGGVRVLGRTFTMYGGEISGNTATGSGGGVYVHDTYTTFRIVSGTIYGSNEGELSNTATNGVALYVNSGTAQRGTFSGETWNSSGTLSTTNDTISVVNGVLQ